MMNLQRIMIHCFFNRNLCLNCVHTWTTVLVITHLNTEHTHKHNKFCVTLHRSLYFWASSLCKHDGTFLSCHTSPDIHPMEDWLACSQKCNQGTNILTEPQPQRHHPQPSIVLEHNFLPEILVQNTEAFWFVPMVGSSEMLIVLPMQMVILVCKGGGKYSA